MKRALVFAVLIGCSGGEPSLELSAGSLRVDQEVTVSASAANGDRSPGTGAVSFVASLGVLEAGSVSLVEGIAKAKLRCPRATAGCVAGASIEVTARWTSPKGQLSQSVTVRVTDPPATDAGRVDAGVDAGTPPVDAGVEPDAGMTLGGTALNGVDGLVLGRLGSPRTVGFSPLTSPGTVALAFDRVPVAAAIWADRLVYGHNGLVRIWYADHFDGGPPPEVDSGVLDAGAEDGGDDGGLDDGGQDLDGGVDDGGQDDGGVDAGPPPDAGRRDAGPTGPFPLFAPEANDPVLASCIGFFAPDAGAVRSLLTTPTGGLWIGCSASPNDDQIGYRRGSTFFAAGIGGALALAGTDDAILAGHSDGGRFLIRAAMTAQLSMTGARRFSEAGARAVPGGFELLYFDDVLQNCGLMFVNSATGAKRDIELEGFFTGDERCLQGQLYGKRDLILVANVDAGARNGIDAIAFSRKMPSVDGGRRDGGVDSGVRDAGTPYTGFTPGPPSDFLAEPPQLSVDFRFPAKVVTDQR